MTTPEEDQRPHLVMIVGNTVTGDSRVLKSAQSAHSAGYRVTVLGLKLKNALTFDKDGPVNIVRVPLNYERYGHWLRSQQLAVAARERTAAQNRMALARIDYQAGRSQLSGRHPALRSVIYRLARLRQRLIPRVSRVRGQLAPATEKVTKIWLNLRSKWPGSWRKIMPQLVDLEHIYLGPMMELQPDLIHVHDRHGLPAADSYAAIQASLGRNVPWVYDAHEWLPGSNLGDHPAHAAGWLGVEADTIQRADAVVTVTADIAEHIRKLHRLPRTPGVVSNAPRERIVPMPADKRRPLREECGLDEDTPLLLYVGVLSIQRGVLTCVRALALLPGVHMAFVCNRNEIMHVQLRDLADELGVRDRVHILEYVPAESVTWYASTATIGISALLPDPPQHALAMPTKLREYLLAGVPVMASDLKTQADFVRHWGVGEIFEPDDEQSLAEAFTKVFANIDHYRSKITNELRNANSWEAQEQVLFDTWASLVPVPKADTHTTVATTEPALTIAMDESQTSTALSAVWTQVSGGPVITVSEAKMQPWPNGLAEATERWAQLNRTPGVVLARPGRHVLGVGSVSLDQDALHLQRFGVGLGAIVEPGTFEPADWVKARVPGHPMWDWDSDFLQRSERQARHNQRVIVATACPRFTTGRLAAESMGNLSWIPLPVSSIPAREGGSRNILVLRGRRTKAERQALESLRDAVLGLGYTVTEASRGPVTVDYASEFDIVVDELATGEYSAGAAMAMGAGCVVVGGRSVFDLRTPILPTEPADLVGTVTELIGQLERDGCFLELSSASVNFIRSEHDPALAIRKIQETVAIAS